MKMNVGAQAGVTVAEPTPTHPRNPERPAERRPSPAALPLSFRRGASRSAASGRLRVLLLVDHARTIGGAERFVTGLAAHLPQYGIEPWVCSTRRGLDPAVRMLERAGVRHISLGRTSTWQLHRFLPLASLLRRERFDVLHANMFGSNVWGTLIGRACRVPVVIAHEHTWSYSDNRLRAFLDGQVIGRLATRFIAVSTADRARMIELEGVPPQKVVIMPYPRIPHDEPDGCSDIRSELGIDRAAPLVAVAAVTRRQKRLDVMLDAHARLLERLPHAHLVLAGGGPCQAELEAQIERLGIGSSAHLLGDRSDVDAILRSADAGALSSDFEGKPLFALECMAAGTPMVTTAVGGLPELITHEETGLLVPPRDPTALASALERVLTDKRLAERLASAAITRSNEYSIESVTQKFVELYHGLAATAGVR